MQYDARGKLSQGLFAKMLMDVGIRMRKPDVDKCYGYFDTDQNNSISSLEYANILSLSDYEIDLAMDRIRHSLLSAISTDLALASSIVAPAPRLDAPVAKVI